MNDKENYELNFRKLIEQFNLSLNSEVPPVNFDAWQIDNNLAVEKITNRMKNIENRLMDFDTDTSEDRIRMRGELTGLRFALSALQ